MKISELIGYLQSYWTANGDVDLDVEFAGTPKTPPPTTQQPTTPQVAPWGLDQSIIAKLIEDWKKRKDEEDEDDYEQKWNPPYNWPFKYNNADDMEKKYGDYCCKVYLTGPINLSKP